LGGCIASSNCLLTLDSIIATLDEPATGAKLYGDFFTPLNNNVNANWYDPDPLY
jgi:hypothetical protein